MALILWPCELSTVLLFVMLLFLLRLYDRVYMLPVKPEDVKIMENKQEYKVMMILNEGLGFTESFKKFSSVTEAIEYVKKNGHIDTAKIYKDNVRIY